MTYSKVTRVGQEEQKSNDTSDINVLSRSSREKKSEKFTFRCSKTLKDYINDHGGASFIRRAIRQHLILQGGTGE